MNHAILRKQNIKPLWLASINLYQYLPLLRVVPASLFYIYTVFKNVRHRGGSSFGLPLSLSMSSAVPSSFQIDSHDKLLKIAIPPIFYPNTSATWGQAIDIISTCPHFSNWRMKYVRS